MSARSRILAAVAAVAAAWAGCGAVDAPAPRAPERPAPAAAVRGRVVDVEGRPLEGAQVLVAPPTGWSRADQGRFEECLLPADRQTRTDADGRFELGLDAPGIVRVLLRRRGFMELDLDREWIPPGTPFDLGEIALAPGARVSGRVVDEDGRPIEGARLGRAWAEGGMSWWAVDQELTRTDAEGRFLIEELYPGWRILTASADGFFPLEFWFTVPHPGARAPDGPLEGEVRELAAGEARVEDGELVLTLVRGPTVHGRVEPSGGRRAPWVLAEVSALNLDRMAFWGGPHIDPGRFRSYPFRGGIPWAFVPVAEDGTFTFGAFVATDLERPLLTLTPVAGWEPWVEPLGPTVQLAHDEQHGELELELAVSPLARANLRVVDAEDRRPLEELAVLAAPRGWPPRPIAQREFPDGRVELELRAEELDLWIAAPRHLPLQRDAISLAPGETTELGELALERATMLALRVFDATTREPIEGATIERGIWSSQPRRCHEFEPDAFRSTTTDAEGRARIVHGGELWIHAEGYEGFYERKPRRASYRRISLQPAPRMEVRVLVTHADGTPAARWPVIVDDDVDSPVVTDERGRARIPGPVETVYAWTRGYWSDDVDPSFWEGTGAELDESSTRDQDVHLRLPELVPLDLTIRQGGRPVPGANVGPAHWTPHLPTDGRGRVLGLRGAIPGPLHIAVWQGESTGTAIFELTVSREHPTQVVDIAPLPSRPR